MAKPEPRRSYEVVIVGGGGHGLATALTDVAWIAGVKAGEFDDLA